MARFLLSFLYVRFSLKNIDWEKSDFVYNGNAIFVG